jgi:hypothetical protein
MIVHSYYCTADNQGSDQGGREQQGERSSSHWGARLLAHLVKPKSCLGVPGAGGGTSLGIGDEPVPGVVVAVPGTVVVVPPGPVVPVGDVVVVLPVLFGVVVVVETPGPGPAAQFGLEIVSVSSVTAPLRASARPMIVTLLVTVMLC